MAISGLLLVACLTAAAQEPSARKDLHASERKAYDQIYSEQREIFSQAPNAFMVRTLTGRKPGRALDVAMGQGRNAIWLASQGWQVTGFDISPVAIAEARKEAAARNLQIEAVLAPHEVFEWGTAKWDVVVFSYYFPRDVLPKVWTALKPGGLILVETFHADTARVRPIGGGFTDNELPRVLKDYRTLVYEDVEDRPDWGLSFGATNRLVRILAQKPAPMPPGCTWEGKPYKEEESMCWGVSRWTCSTDGWKHAGKCSP